MTKRRSQDEGSSCDVVTTQTAADGRTSGAGHGAKTEAVRERAIVALLSEPTIGDAATRCGIGERTLRRRFCVVHGVRVIHELPE